MGVLTRHRVRQLATACALGLFGAVILLAGAWCALAVWFRLPAQEAVRAAAAALVASAALITAFRVAASGRWKVLALYALVVACVLAWWTTIQPSNDRDWDADVARTATGTITDDRLTIDNVRNFDWRSDTSFDARWERRDYDLRRLASTDLIMSYWAGEAIAHMIVSFGFDDGVWLAFSVETRKERGEAFSAIAGFFKQYELTIIAADERDVVRVRSNVRGEDVRIYRTRLGPAQARQLIGAYVQEMNRLAARPAFYDTLTANCTTVVFDMVQVIQPGPVLDPRVVLSGYFPDYVHALGGLAGVPMTELREAARIRSRAAAADQAADFSTMIRRGLPIPQTQE